MVRRWKVATGEPPAEPVAFNAIRASAIERVIRPTSTHVAPASAENEPTTSPDTGDRSNRNNSSDADVDTRGTAPATAPTSLIIATACPPEYPLWTRVNSR